MDKKEKQIAFLNKAIQEITNRGLKKGWFIKQIGISPTHWFFLKKGERGLTDASKQKILQIINSPK